MSTQLDIFNGSPVFYHSESKDAKQYLGYRTSSLGEEISMVDIPSNPSFAYSPIIEILKFPRLLESADESHKALKRKYQTVQVKDLMS